MAGAKDTKEAPAKATSPVPQLGTERLILRAVSMNDVDDVFAYASRPEVTRYTIFDYHRLRIESETFVRSVLDGYARGVPPVWAIESREAARIIGTIAMKNLSEADSRVEVGYAIGPEFWGRGYVAEALRAVLAYAFGTMKLNRVEAKVVPAHTASRRVLEKCGFQFEGVLRQHEFVKGEFNDIAVYSILRSEYES
jgi:[ribosomal protein S5]-alanine N-acetyltransferase